MRLLLAALFVFAGTLLAVALLSGFGDRLPPLLQGIILALNFLLLCGLACYLFNPRELWWRPGVTAEQHIREMEERGLLVSADFLAVRAFQVEEFEDEGLHYFLELADGSVLYLTGQYLYDYEPTEDDPELAQPRRFPCSDFTVRRHRHEGYVVEIDCRGTPLEPERVAPPFRREQYRRGEVPEDGEIITDRTYEELKQLTTRTR